MIMTTTSIVIIAIFYVGFGLLIFSMLPTDDVPISNLFYKIVFSILWLPLLCFVSMKELVLKGIDK